MQEALSTEMFRSREELAQIGVEISTLRASLDALRASEAEYVAERALEAEKAVSGALEASKEALREADSNREALKSLLNELKSYAEELSRWEGRRQAAIAEQQRELDILETQLASNAENLRGVANDQRALSDALSSERDRLSGLALDLARRETVLNDREGALDRKITRKDA